jgi:hypothetical protein
MDVPDRGNPETMVMKSPWLNNRFTKARIEVIFSDSTDADCCHNLHRLESEMTSLPRFGDDYSQRAGKQSPSSLFLTGQTL